MNFLGALEALEKKKCKGIKPTQFLDVNYYHLNSDGILVFMKTKGIATFPSTFLGEWELVGEVVIPKPGEVWQTKDGFLTLVSNNGKFMIFDDLSQSKINKSVIETENGWKRIAEPGYVK